MHAFLNIGCWIPPTLGCISFQTPSEKWRSTARTRRTTSTPTEPISTPRSRCTWGSSGPRGTSTSPASLSSYVCKFSSWPLQWPFAAAGGVLTDPDSTCSWHSSYNLKPDTWKLLGGESHNWVALVRAQIFWASSGCGVGVRIEKPFCLTWESLALKG